MTTLANAGDDTTDGGKLPPFVVSFTGAEIVLGLSCQQCKAITVTVRSTLPVPARVFLKSWLRGKQPELESVSILCQTCEANHVGA